MSSPSVQAGIDLAVTVVKPACLGFIPVAIHFDLFGHLVRARRPVTSDEVAATCNAKIREAAKGEPELCAKLAEDTLFIMAGLGLVDQVSDNAFSPNALTKHMVDRPGAQDGVFHFATDALFAGAFTYRKLKDSNFEYPFKEADGPMQHAYKLLGDERLSKMHTYSIIAHEGRMPSFNRFMTDGFFEKLAEPDYIKSIGYDLDAAIARVPQGTVTVVDVGGGNGHTLLQFKDAYPQLEPKDLIVQDCFASVDNVPGITLMKWDFKDNTPQPIQGAGIYCLQHILHNNPDLQAAAILQKIAKAMNADSRLLVIEYTKDKINVPIHASMIALYGGRERSSEEYKQMANLAGLEVTFEAFPPHDECLLEMRKRIDN